MVPPQRKGRGEGEERKIKFLCVHYSCMVSVQAHGPAMQNVTCITLKYACKHPLPSSVREIYERKSAQLGKSKCDICACYGGAGGSADAGR